MPRKKAAKKTKKKLTEKDIKGQEEIKEIQKQKSEILTTSSEARQSVVGLKHDQSKEGLEEQLEDLNEGINNEQFTEFLRSSTQSTTPVLERVAGSQEEDLEQAIANIQPGQIQNREEEKQISYTNTTSDYLTLGGTAEGRESAGVQYNESSLNYATMVQQTKETRETRRSLGQGDMGGNRTGNRWEREKMMEVEEIEKEKEMETKRYIAGGDHRDYK